MKFFFLNNWVELSLALLLVIQFWFQVNVIPQQGFWIFIVSILFIVVMIVKKNKDEIGIQKLVDGLNVNHESEQKRTDQLINEVTRRKEEAETRSSGLEEQNSLISRLIKEGLITEKNVYKIIHKYKFYYLFCYQNVPDQKKVQEVLGKDFRNPSLEAIESIGFIKVGTRHNLYIVPHDYLPTRLRNSFTLERVVRKQVFKYWKIFLDRLKLKNDTFFKKYLRNNPNPTNCTYMISTSNFHDVIISYIGYNAFSSNFKNLLNNRIDLNQLKKEVSKRKYDIHKFITTISYDLFLADLPMGDKKIFVDKEDVLKHKLSVLNFTDYRNKENQLKKELEKYFSVRKSINYAKVISSKSKKYYDLFSALGISLD